MSDTTYKSKVGYNPPVEPEYHEGMPEIKSVWDNMRDAAGNILDQVEEHVVAQCSVAVGVKIDREELIKALRYDRGQYEKGYADGRRDAAEALQENFDVLIFKLGEAAEMLKKMQDRIDVVRCRECKWYQPDLCANPWGVCFHEDWVANNIGHTVDENGFCYRGEREVQE